MIKGRRLFYTKVDYFTKILNARPNVRHCGVAGKAEENVFISPRIERGPTDILKALSLTVGADHTAFHYKYPDDPYFYPHSTERKKILALSLESGRKSAKWIFKNNPGFFSNQLSEPPIEEFLVKPVLSGESEPTEKTLLTAIEERNVSKAIEVFQTLENANFDVSKSTRQCLLELICFYDSEEQLSEDVEKNWFKDVRDVKKCNSWKNKDFAQKLFEKMDSSCSLANSAIIQGMIKHNEILLARQYFEAARVQKVKLTVDVYNMFLSKISEILDSNSKIGLIKKILSDMSEKKIMPNLGTLNALLSSLTECNHFNGKVKFTQQVLAEFKRLGIEPSLGSYGYVFRILSYPMKLGEYLFLARSIMDHIEYKNFEILHPSDLKFFTNAVVAFGYQKMDPEFSVRLLNMFFRNNNSKFICTFMDENQLFEGSLLVILEQKPIEFSMDLYRRFAFTHFTPSPRVLLSVISAIGRNQASVYLAGVWEDINKLHSKKIKFLISELLGLIRFFSDESSLKVFHSAAVCYLKLLKSEDYFSEDERVLSDILVAFLKNDDEKNILSFLKNFPIKTEVCLKPNAIKALYNYALSKQNISLLLESLKIAAELKYPNVSQMASKAVPFLEGDAKAWAAKIVNHEEAKL